MQRLLASVLLPVAVGAMLLGWFGILLDGRVTVLAVAFAFVFAAASAVLLLAAVAAASGAAQLGVMALMGAFTATFALPQIPCSATASSFHGCLRSLRGSRSRPRS